jgi:hypothetical protein
MIHEQTVKTIAGTAVTGGSVVTSFVAAALPIVQFVAACIGVCVGLATLIYYIKLIRKK